MLTVNELFSGIGAFRKALIRLKIHYEIVGISEIDKFAIKSYNAIYGDTRNYGDISKIDKLDYADLWTYGFPCQDISNAGNQQGLIKGKTRSGLLYEVQRLLGISALYDELPKYLIMENVKPLVGKKFLPKFQEWLEWLSGCGYNNYWKVMNAADYGIPQKRERVIAVSIRKDIDRGFSFPYPIPLKVQFKDLLEDKVDEKYYLTNATYNAYLKRNEVNKSNGVGFRFEPVERERFSQTQLLRTQTGVTVTTAKTLTTKENGMREISYMNCKQIATLNNSKYESSARVYCPSGLCPTLTTNGGGHHEVKIMEDKSNVRKLTPLEYWRLMGFDDSDFNKAQAVNSDTQLYKQAGNSIVVNVLEAVLRNLLEGTEYETGNV